MTVVLTVEEKQRKVCPITGSLFIPASMIHAERSIVLKMVHHVLNVVLTIMVNMTEFTRIKTDEQAEVHLDK